MQKRFVAGYYDYDSGAHYVSPIATGTALVGLVELHELIHQHLAHSNVTDGLGRILTNSITPQGDSLFPANSETARDQLLANIGKNTVEVHEIAATYLSFGLFHKNNPDLITDARRVLPSFYQKCLKQGERSFGPIGNVQDPEDWGPELFMLCAIAALNIDYPPDELCPDNFGKFAKCLSRHSPNVRFRTILKTVQPFWLVDSIFYGINRIGIQRKDVQSIQMEAARRLRRHLPNIRFFTHDERPSVLRSWNSQLENYFNSIGHSVTMVLAQSDTEAAHFARYSSRIDLPGIAPESPLDLSLVKLRYVESTIGILLGGIAIASKASDPIHVHILVPFENSHRIRCFNFWPLKELLNVFPPFTVECDFDEWFPVIQLAPRGSIIIKIDERFGAQMATTFADMKHPTFMLAHDTRVVHIAELIEELAGDSKMSIGSIPLKGHSFRALLATNIRNQLTVVSPITDGGFNILMNNLYGKPFAHVNTTIEEFRGYLPVHVERVFEIVGAMLRHDFDLYR